MAKKLLKGVGSIAGSIIGGGGKSKATTGAGDSSVAAQLGPIISQLPPDSPLRRKMKNAIPRSSSAPGSTILRDTLGGG